MFRVELFYWLRTLNDADIILHQADICDRDAASGAQGGMSQFKFAEGGRDLFWTNAFDQPIVEGWRRVIAFERQEFVTLEIVQSFWSSVFRNV